MHLVARVWTLHVPQQSLTLISRDFVFIKPKELVSERSVVPSSIFGTTNESIGLGHSSLIGADP